MKNFKNSLIYGLLTVFFISLGLFLSYSTADIIDIIILEKEIPYECVEGFVGPPRPGIDCLDYNF